MGHGQRRWRHTAITRGAAQDRLERRRRPDALLRWDLDPRPALEILEGERALMAVSADEQEIAHQDRPLGNMARVDYASTTCGRADLLNPEVSAAPDGRAHNQQEHALSPPHGQEWLSIP